jgi:response regulator RpfG family c-di-GMP phosphodiesterase
MGEHTILFVDDEENILSALKRVLRRENYRIITASSGREALEVMERNQIQVVISDQRMPEMSGTEFMTHVMRRYPDAVRIILSGYTDVDTITNAVNEGHIYKFLLKPWNDEALKMEIDCAINHYELVNLNKSLHQKVLEQNEELKRYNESLEDIIKSRTRDLEIQNQVLELSREILENIPTPVIGVSEEKILVLINSAAYKLSFDGKHLTVGNDFADYFPDSVTEILRVCLEGKTSSCIRDYIIEGEIFDIDFTPLLDKENRSGVILLLQHKAKNNAT